MKSTTTTGILHVTGTQMNSSFNLTGTRATQGKRGKPSGPYLLGRFYISLIDTGKPILKYRQHHIMRWRLRRNKKIREKRWTGSRISLSPSDSRCNVISCPTLPLANAFTSVLDCTLQPRANRNRASLGSYSLFVSIKDPIYTYIAIWPFNHFFYIVADLVH